MFLSKFFTFIAAKFNKLGNFFFEQDPIAVLQLEYDRAVEDLKEGREGLEQYRGLVESIQRKVEQGDAQVARIEAKIKAYLQAGSREAASRHALELQKIRARVASDRQQLAQHEQAYQNFLMKVKAANHKLAELKDKIKSYDAELKMSKAEAEIAKLSSTLSFDVTTDFAQVEGMIQGQIDKNRGAVRVAVDLSEEGIESIREQEALDAQLAENALREFEMGLGLVSPETTDPEQVEKVIGTHE